MRSFLVVVATAISATTVAQNVTRCVSPQAVRWRANSHPNYQSRVNATYEWARSQAMHRKIGEDDTVVYRIPVVVHVVWNTPEQNIGTELIHAQIAQLNLDFRRKTADTSLTRSQFLPVAADSRIEFYLAGTDPQGNPTGGIDRVYTTRAHFDMGLSGQNRDDMKQSSQGGADAWDTDRYLNIWVCNNNEPDPPLGTILGFSYPPASAPNWPFGSSAPQPEFEGIVVYYKVFGPNNPLATGILASEDRGRVAVHEAGHYFGLRHTWGDAFTDGCSADDGLTDTPNCRQDAFRMCDLMQNTCVDEPFDFHDQIENYMDVADEDCQNMFTRQQVDLMRAMIEGPRLGLTTGTIPPSSIDFIRRNELIMYPNPTQGPVHFEALGAEKITISDLQGRIVAEVRVPLTGTAIWNGTTHQSGVYLASVQWPNGEVANQKLVLH